MTAHAPIPHAILVLHRIESGERRADGFPGPWRGR